jgi:hypothetical protein
VSQFRRTYFTWKEGFGEKTCLFELKKQKVERGGGIKWHKKKPNGLMFK